MMKTKTKTTRPHRQDENAYLPTPEEIQREAAIIRAKQQGESPTYIVDHYPDKVPRRNRSFE